MAKFNPPLPAAWRGIFGPSYSSEQFDRLGAAVDAAYAAETVYPARENIFRALADVPPEKCRVVILGQDPYPSPGNAQGLSFSIPPGAKIPGSLVTIFKELERSVPGWKRPASGNLEPWAKQGVLLLNTVLTVQALKPLSHAKLGWKEFTQAALQYVQTQSPRIVFLLWGGNAQGSRRLIDETRHAVLTSTHPSLLAQNSAPPEKKFVGNNHFVETNRLLTAAGLAPIVW